MSVPVGSSSTTPDEGRHCPICLGAMPLHHASFVIQAEHAHHMRSRVVVGHPNEADPEPAEDEALWDDPWAHAEACVATTDFALHLVQVEQSGLRDILTAALKRAEAAEGRLAAIQAVCDEEWRDGFGDFVQALRTILAGGVVDG